MRVVVRQGFYCTGDLTLQELWADIDIVRVIVTTATIIQIAVIDLARIGCDAIEVVPEIVQFAQSLLHSL